jgi:hypothetical protein
MNNWKKADEELACAFQAREFENEGMARVCARRAAGWAIKGYLSAHSLPIPTPNAFQLLSDPWVSGQFPQPIKEIISHLSQRATVDHKFNDLDLLAEAKELVTSLQNLSSSEIKNVC